MLLREMVYFLSFATTTNDDGKNRNKETDKFYSTLNRIEVFKIKFAIVAPLCWSEQREHFFFDFSHNFTLREIKSPYSGQKQRGKKESCLKQFIGTRKSSRESQYETQINTKHLWNSRFRIGLSVVFFVRLKEKAKGDKCIHCESSASSNGKITSILTIEVWSIRRDYM